MQDGRIWPSLLWHILLEPVSTCLKEVHPQVLHHPQNIKSQSVYLKWGSEEDP